MDNTKTINSGVGDDLYYQTHYLSRVWNDYLWIVDKAKQLSVKGKVVDLGCGVGYLVEAFHNSGYECVGIEGAEAGVKIAQSRNSELKIFHQMLSEKLPFEDNSVQIVILNQVIEHLESSVQQNCISEAYRILAKGGLILVYSPSKYNLDEQKADATHINLLSPTELSVLLRSNGFHSLIVLSKELIYLWDGGKIIKKITNKLYRIIKPERLMAHASFAAYK